MTRWLPCSTKTRSIRFKRKGEIEFAKPPSVLLLSSSDWSIVARVLNWSSWNCNTLTFMRDSEALLKPFRNRSDFWLSLQVSFFFFKFLRGLVFSCPRNHGKLFTSTILAPLFGCPENRKRKLYITNSLYCIIFFFCGWGCFGFSFCVVWALQNLNIINAIKVSKAKLYFFRQPLRHWGCFWFIFYSWISDDYPC